MRYIHSIIKLVIRNSHFDLYYLYSSTREKLKQYGEILEEEAFVSEQRAYCQGYVDCIQLLAGLGLLKKSTDMEKIISEMKSN